MLIRRVGGRRATSRHPVWHITDRNAGERILRVGYMSLIQRTSGRRAPERTYFHGTYHDYARPKLNALDVLWLTADRSVAYDYGDRHWRPEDSSVTVWRIVLKPNAHIVDLADPANPHVSAFKDSVNITRRMSFGELSDGEWPCWADFGMFDGYAWTAAFFLDRGVQGVLVNDSHGGRKRGSYKHRSLALLDLGVIASMERD